MSNIKIVGVGGGGLNAVNHMIDSKLTGAEFIACNLFEFCIEMSKADKKILLGKRRRWGLDGGSPERSRQAAIESREEILEALHGSNAVILIAGLGGNTGAGSTPIIAECAKEIGALTVAVVNLPFTFEGPWRKKKAKAGLKNLSAQVDSIIKIQSDKLVHMVDKKSPVTAVLKCLDEIMTRAVRTLVAVFQNAYRIDTPLAV